MWIMWRNWIASVLRGGCPDGFRNGGAGEIYRRIAKVELVPRFGIRNTCIRRWPCERMDVTPTGRSPVEERRDDRMRHPWGTAGGGVSRGNSVGCKNGRAVEEARPSGPVMGLRNPIGANRARGRRRPTSGIWADGRPGRARRRVSRNK